MDTIEASIMRVMQGNSVVGAAFLVSDRVVATCAHVVQSAGVKVGGKISLRLAGGKKIEATVEPEFWRDPNAEDISILSLDEPLGNIQPLRLGSSSGTKGNKFSTFGFPEEGQELSGGGEIIGPATINEIKALQLRSPEVTPGFSGAPIFDEITKRVVGMVVAITPPDQYQRLGTTAFAIPSETIRDVCSKLQISDICPYKSLDVFTEEDAPFFFGREQVVQKMIDSLKHEPRFLAVLGPSGSGKSSVVRAGLIPALHQGKVPGSQKWDIVTIRPANDPFDQLAGTGFIDLEAGLEGSVKAWLADRQHKTRLVLFIDQFEEVLVSVPKDVRQKFIADLGQLLDAPVAISIVITLRDDFYSQFQKEASLLADWKARGQIDIPQGLETGHLHAMIVEPAQRIGITFAEGLVDTIIEDACGIDRTQGLAKSTVLPLLEFALTQLWELRQDGQLTFDAYKNIGGITGSISQWSDRVYHELSPQERKLAEQIFCHLVHLGNEKEQIPDTRRVITISELSKGLKRELVEPVVDVLIKARLLSVHREIGTDQQLVEIIHDAMLQEWKLLEKWIDGFRHREQKARERKRNLIIFGLLIGLAIVAVLAVFAWAQRNTAVAEANSRATAESNAINETNARATALVNEVNAKATAQAEKLRAEERATIARAGELSTLAFSFRETNIELSLLLSIEAFQKADTVQTRGVLLDNTQFMPNLLQVLPGNAYSITSIAFTPDGNTIAVSDHAQKVILWDVKSGKRLGNPLTDFPTWVGQMHFSPDGKILACESSGIVSLWNVNSQENIGNILIPEWGIDIFAFSPDGKQLASVGCSKTDNQQKCKEREITFWDLYTFKPTRKIVVKAGDAIYGLEFSPDGKLLVSGGANNQIMLWDASTGIHLGPSITGNSPLTFSPDGKILAFARKDNSIILWDIENHTTVGEPLRGHTGLLSNLVFSQGGKILESVSNYDVSIRIWDVTSHQQIKLITGRQNGIRPYADYGGIGSVIVFSPDGNTYASSARNYETIDLWSLSNVTPISHQLLGDKRVYSLAFSPDGKYLASANGSPQASGWISDITLWNLKTFDVIDRIPNQNSQNVMFSPHGNELLSTIGNYSILKLNMSTFKTLEQLLEGGVKTGVYEGVFSPDGANYALLSLRQIKLWDVNTGKRIETGISGHTDVVNCIVFSPDGSILASGGDDKNINLWNLITHQAVGKPLMVSENDVGIYSLAFSPDGKTLASGSANITLWDVASKKSLIQLHRNDEVIRSMAFSPDGKILASGSSDGSIVLWNVTTGQPIGQPLVGHTYSINSVAFSPDGTTLASGGWDNNINLWDINPQSWIKKTCQRVGRNLTQAEWQQYFPGEAYHITCPQWSVGQ
jgi:WD40 repeat protein